MSDGKAPPYNNIRQAYEHLMNYEDRQPYEYHEDDNWAVVYFDKTLIVRLFPTLEMIGKMYSWSIMWCEAASQRIAVLSAGGHDEEDARIGDGFDGHDCVPLNDSMHQTILQNHIKPCFVTLPMPTRTNIHDPSHRRLLRHHGGLLYY